MAATVKDLAKESGVSTGTISKYLNGVHVRPDNAKRIEAAIKKLDYSYNQIASYMRKQRSNTLGIIVPVLNVDYCRTLAMTCQRILRDAGYNAQIYACDSDAREEQRVLRALLARRVGGIIALPCDASCPQYLEARERGLPVIFVGDCAGGPSITRVYVNDLSAGKELIARIARSGRRRVGVIVGRTEYQIMTTRLEVFRQALADEGLDLPNELIHQSRLLSLDAGYLGAKDLLSKPSPPSVILALNGDLLVGAKIALLEAGLSIPEDILLAGNALLSLSDTEVMRDIPLVAQPLDEVANTAANFLLSMLHTPSADSLRRMHTVTAIDAKLHMGRF